MFQISVSPKGRSTASALTVLAAMGASGMVAEEASAAIIVHEPNHAIYAQNSSYVSLNWNNWLDDNSWHGLNATSRTYIQWGDIFSDGVIDSAVLSLERINTGATYGVPNGSHFQVNLVTQFWDTTTISGGFAGPSVGTTAGTESLLIEVNDTDNFLELDITSLIANWQLNPSAYYGIRIYSTDSNGGIWDPNNFDNGGNDTSANLVVDVVAIPEPASMGLLALGGLLGLRRRRTT